MAGLRSSKSSPRGGRWALQLSGVGLRSCVAALRGFDTCRSHASKIRAKKNKKKQKNNVRLALGFGLAWLPSVVLLIRVDRDYKQVWLRGRWASDLGGCLTWFCSLSLTYKQWNNGMLTRSNVELQELPLRIFLKRKLHSNITLSPMYAGNFGVRFATISEIIQDCLTDDFVYTAASGFTEIWVHTIDLPL